jgi:polysaccharide export outer membrane protein
MGSSVLFKKIEHGFYKLHFYFAAIALAGCSASQTITNLEPISEGSGYQAQYRARNQPNDIRIEPVSNEMNMIKCSWQPDLVEKPNVVRDEERLSPGDIVDIAIGNDETLSGKYEVSIDGKIKVRGLSAAAAIGLTTTKISENISHALVDANFYDRPPLVSVRLMDYGSVRAFVSGAVFEAGSVRLAGSAISNNNDITREQALGATSDGRRLSRALQSAGGIRPDADLSRVSITRLGKTQIVDLRQAFIGGRYRDDLILEGDEIDVPSRGCFQSDLVKPSSISPVGVKVFVSNLTEPALSNANSSNNKDTREMPYGTRFLQTIIGMNCVGGSKLTNASRSAVLFSRNPLTGKSVVIERNIEELLRHANRDDYDPYMLPNDALACYDSGTTDVVNVAKGFGIVAGSLILGRGL